MEAETTGGRSDRFAPTITFAPDSAERSPRIDLNRATAAELLPLPGVDRVRAGRIVAARTRQRFAHVDELLSRGVVPASVFSRIRGRVRADFMDEPYLTGVAPAGGSMRAARPSVLEVRFEDSQPGVRLVHLQAHSVSHSLDLSREVTATERRRGMIAFPLPPMAQGVMNVEATLYDGAGSRDQVTRTVAVLPDLGELTVAAHPAGGSLRTVNGAARPTSDGGYLCSAAFEFSNGTRFPRTVRRRVDWKAYHGRWNTLEGSFDFGRDIAVPAEGTSTGWFLDIRFPRTSGISQALRDKGVVTIVYRFTEPSGNTHQASLTWRVVRGPHVNIIYVGSELFSTADRQAFRAGLEVTRGIFAQRDFGIGRILEYNIPVAQAGRFTVINDNGEARELTNSYTVPNDGMDLFVVDLYEGSVIGYSAIEGPCEKNENWWQIKDMTGSVVELYTHHPGALGQLIGHELAHYLGLEHASIRWTENAQMNLMWPVSGIFRTQITAGQANDMRDHCFMRNLG